MHLVGGASHCETCKGPLLREEAALLLEIRSQFGTSFSSERAAGLQAWCQGAAKGRARSVRSWPPRSPSKRLPHPAWVGLCHGSETRHGAGANLGCDKGDGIRAASAAAPPRRPRALPQRQYRGCVAGRLNAGFLHGAGAAARQRGSQCASPWLGS